MNETWQKRLSVRHSWKWMVVLLVGCVLLREARDAWFSPLEVDEFVLWLRMENHGPVDFGYLVANGQATIILMMKAVMGILGDGRASARFAAWLLTVAFLALTVGYWRKDMQALLVLVVLLAMNPVVDWYMSSFRHYMGMMIFESALMYFALRYWLNAGGRVSLLAWFALLVLPVLTEPFVGIFSCVVWITSAIWFFRCQKDLVPQIRKNRLYGVGVGMIASLANVYLLRRQASHGLIFPGRNVGEISVLADMPRALVNLLGMDFESVLSQAGVIFFVTAVTIFLDRGARPRERFLIEILALYLGAMLVLCSIFVVPLYTARYLLALLLPFYILLVLSADRFADRVPRQVVFAMILIVFAGLPLFRRAEATRFNSQFLPGLEAFMGEVQNTLASQEGSCVEVQGKNRGQEALTGATFYKTWFAKDLFLKQRLGEGCDYPHAVFFGDIETLRKKYQEEKHASLKTIIQDTELLGAFYAVSPRGQDPLLVP